MMCLVSSSLETVSLCLGISLEVVLVITARLIKTRSSADADNALDANEADIRVIRGVPNFRKSIT